ncbi:hypothetical protein GJAV_G00269510 [Gymnothorax javanicus]|nr:hypothetical protein GJAV_G00269510 [Gymnothorax javanicus]
MKKITGMEGKGGQLPDGDKDLADDLNLFFNRFDSPPHPCLHPVEHAPKPTLSPHPPPITIHPLQISDIKEVKHIRDLSLLSTLNLLRNPVQDNADYRLAVLFLLQQLSILDQRDVMAEEKISDIKEVKHIRDVPLLSTLNLLRNPVQDNADYRLAVLFLLQQLSILDQRDVMAEEKVSAVNKYDPPAEVIAARDHMMHTVYQLRQPQVIFDSTLPSLSTPYPMLVLAGPQACGKRELTHRLCHDFSQFFAYGICHTTREPYVGEEDGLDYHYVSEEQFQEMILSGKFIQSIQYAGHRYGLSRAAIEEVAREGLACCVHMEVEGVHCLKNTYFEPRYILLVPTDRERYAKRLRERGLYTHEQMDRALSRVDAYVRLNRERPGYFDNVITCDDPVEAYEMLRQVVREYLGLEERGGTDDTRATPGDSLTDVRTGLTGQSDVSRSLYSKVQQRLAPPMSPAEVASLQRRQQLVREAVSGRSPGVFSRPIHRVSMSAPVQQGGQNPISPSPIPPEPTEINSSLESHPSSTLPSLQDSTVGGVRGSETEPPEPGHDLDSLRDHVDSGSYPQSASSLTVQSESTSVRPGSNAKPVLPPIPSGRKTCTPNPARS